MSKRFSRNIFPGDGNKEPLDTNLVGDFLVSSKESDSRYGKGDAWIRKEGGYHCLTDNIKSLTSDLADIVGVTPTGKNSRRLKVNPEILTNDKVKTSGLIQKTDSGNDGITLGLGIETIADGLSELNRFLEIDRESLDEIAENGEVDEYIRLRNKDHVFNVPTYKYVKGLAGNTGGETSGNIFENLEIESVSQDGYNLIENVEDFGFDENKFYFNSYNGLITPIRNNDDTKTIGLSVKPQKFMSKSYGDLRGYFDENIHYDDKYFIAQDVYWDEDKDGVNSSEKKGEYLTLNDEFVESLKQSGGGSVKETFTLENIELIPPMGISFAESQFENRLLIDSKNQYLHLETQNESGEVYKNKYLKFNDDLLKREISSEVRNAIGENNENGSVPDNVLTRDDIGDGNGAELVSRTNIGANFSHIKTINVYENTEITYTQRNVFNNGEAWIRTIEKPDDFYQKLKGETGEDNLFIEESHILMSRFVINYHAIDHYRENQVELNIPIENGGDMSINEGILSLVTPNLEENTIEVKNYIVRDSYAHKQLLNFYGDDRILITTFDKERHPVVSNYILSRFDVEKTLEGNSEKNE